MRDIERRLGRLEDASPAALLRFEFWASDSGWSTSMDTGEEIPSAELKDRPLPRGTRRIEFVCDDETAETTR